MNARRKKSIAISAIVLFGIFIGYRIYERLADATSVREETLESAIPNVAVTHPKPLPPTAAIALPGNMTGWYEAPIYARVTGYVKMWYKDYGAEVKQGDILAEISTPDLDAEYRQVKADLEAERAKYVLADVSAKRWIALRPNHAVSEQSITVKEQKLKVQAALVKAAEQKVKNIEAFIGFKTVVAPFDGVVIQRNINVGDLVSKEGSLSSPNAKTNLYTVAVVDRLRVFVSVPESFGPFLQPGLTADVTVPQLPDRHFTAKFLTVARGFDVNTRTAVTVFIIENEDKALWPGSYAEVHLTAPVHSNVLTIPSSAMVFQEEGTEVVVVGDDDRVHFRPIAVSKIRDAEVEVTNGVSVEDRLVNNPSAALLEGDKVRIVTPAPGYHRVAEEPPALQESSSTVHPASK